MSMQTIDENYNRPDSPIHDYAFTTQRQIFRSDGQLQSSAHSTPWPSPTMMPNDVHYYPTYGVLHSANVTPHHSPALMPRGSQIQNQHLEEVTRLKVKIQALEETIQRMQRDIDQHVDFRINELLAKQQRTDEIFLKIKEALNANRSPE